MSTLDDAAKMLREKWGGLLSVYPTSIGLGLYNSDGAEIGFYVEADSLGNYRITDKGEAWGSLVADGLADVRPGPKHSKMLRELAHRFSLSVGHEWTEIFVHAKPEALADAVARLAAMGLALDGWRPWLAHERAAAVPFRSQAIVRDVLQLAREREWEADPRATIRGSRFNWRCDVRLSRGLSHVAVEALPGGAQNRDTALQAAAGWIAETSEPLVFLVDEDIRDDVARLGVLERVAVVAKQRDGAAEEVMDEAERVAAAA